MVADRRYEFGAAAEDDTLVAGLRAGQLVIAAAGLTIAVLAFRADSSPRGLALAVSVLGVAAAVAFWRVAGRSLEQWVPIVGRWTLRRLTSRNRNISVLPLLGDDDQEVQVPPDTLAGVAILAAPIRGEGGRQVGVIHDRRAGTYAGVLRVRGRSFQLADTPEKERRLAAWGGVLAGLARTSSPIERIQWVERTVPDDGDVMGRYLAGAARVPVNHPSLAAYLEVVDAAGPAAPEHEAFLVVSISRSRARRAVRQAGGGDEGAVEVLLRELSSLRRTLSSADVVVDGMLTPRLVAGAIRTGFEPSSSVRLARRASAAGEEGGASPSNAWPLATDASWGAYRTEDAWHATYWVAQWPRTPVGADFLTPLLLGTVGMRSIAVTMEPIPPDRAHREVEQQIVKSRADEELRTRAGFTSTARRRRTQEAVARREQELADGHADYRVSGFVTVTAPTQSELEAACGEVEQAAQQSFLELRRLYGQQDLAFTFTLPLARGLS